MSLRKIIHIDMDAFFAAVEQRDNAHLRGLPIAVGFDGPRGVVSTASYEARRFGVHSAMSVLHAKRLCPQLIVVNSHYDRYKAISHQIHEVFHEYTDLVEPISLDEAFLDVTHNKKGIIMAQDIAIQIKQRIKELTQLTASAGVSYNKFLAKIASDYRKPDGMFVIHPDRAQSFIDALPVERFWGVGPVTARRMHQMGIFTGADLRRTELRRLTEVFGKAGKVYYEFAKGIDPRPVEPHYERKSVGCEHTFEHDLWKKSALLIELHHTATELEERISKSQFSGVTLTLKVKFSDFTIATRSHTTDTVFHDKDSILPVGKNLLQQLNISENHPIRLMGLSVSNPSGNDRKNDDAGWQEGWLPFDFYK